MFLIVYYLLISIETIFKKSIFRVARNFAVLIFAIHGIFSAIPEN